MYPQCLYILAIPMTEVTEQVPINTNIINYTHDGYSQTYQTLLINSAGLSASSAAGRGAMVQPTGWTRARNCGRWLLVLCFSSYARSSAAFDCTEDSHCQYGGCDNRACSSTSSECVDGFWTASCVSTTYISTTQQSERLCAAFPPSRVALL